MKLHVRILWLFAIIINIKQAQAVNTSGLADTVNGSKLVVGKPLPLVILQTPEGAGIKGSSVSGKVVLVDFWASWCMPCRASIPHLKELYQKYHADGFEILSVSIDQSSKAWKVAMQKEAMPWPQALDHYDAGKDASDLMASLGITSVPFVILLDEHGNVQLINPAKEEMEQQLKKIFKH